MFSLHRHNYHFLTDINKCRQETDYYRCLFHPTLLNNAPVRVHHPSKFSLTCQERCIRSVPTTDVVRVIRNLAFREGYAKKPHLMVCKYLFEQGHAVPINPPTKALRKKLGLGELPPTVHSYPEGLKEVNIICEKTGFKALWKKQFEKVQ